MERLRRWCWNHFIVTTIAITACYLVMISGLGRGWTGGIVAVAALLVGSTLLGWLFDLMSRGQEVMRREEKPNLPDWWPDNAN